jgi:hypothetical protein
MATPRGASDIEDDISGHTTAQDLGYGVIDTAAEGSGLTEIYFYSVFTPTPVPVTP